MTTSHAVAFEHVGKRYGALEAVRDLSFSVQRGEMFGLIGRDPVREHRAITASVGYLSQRFSLYGDLSVDENVAFFAEIHGVSDYRRRRDQLLDMTQLTPFRARLA